MVYAQTIIHPKNEVHKILCDFEIQTDHLIPVRRPDLEVISKKKKERERERTFRLIDFAIPADRKVIIKESENIDEYLNLARELKKSVYHAGDGDSKCSWSTGNCPQNNWEADWNSRKLEEESRPFRLEHC